MSFGRVCQPHRPRCADLACEDVGEMMDATITSCKLHLKAPPSSKISLSLLLAKHMNFPIATQLLGPDIFGSTTTEPERTPLLVPICFRFKAYGMEKATVYRHRSNRETREVESTTKVRGPLAFPDSFCRLDAKGRRECWEELDRRILRFCDNERVAGLQKNAPLSAPSGNPNCRSVLLLLCLLSSSVCCKSNQLTQRSRVHHSL